MPKFTAEIKALDAAWWIDTFEEEGGAVHRLNHAGPFGTEAEARRIAKIALDDLEEQNPTFRRHTMYDVRFLERGGLDGLSWSSGLRRFGSIEEVINCVNAGKGNILLYAIEAA